MPNYTVTLNNALSAEVQKHADDWNAEQTSIKAAKTPPEVHTNLTLEQFIDMRVTAIARDYKRQNDENSGARIRNAYNNASPTVQATVKTALGLS